MSSTRLTGRRLPLQKGFGCNALEDGRAMEKLIAASKTSGALNLSNRQLQEVPQGVFRLTEDDDSVKWWEAVDLTKLDLSHNQVVQLPQEMWSLTALATLLLSNNQLQQVQPGISELQSLRLLELSDNPTLGPALPDAVALLPSLATLNCNNCALEQLPAALGGPQQPKLSVLSVCGNQLAHLPDGLSAATALVVLKAAQNQLQELPSKLTQGCRALKELDLSHNKLRELPTGLGQLPALLQLDVRNNQLSDLPPSLGEAATLQELRLGFNQLGNLPSKLAGLTNLKTLDLRNNLVQELPEPLCGLQLVLLDCTNNCLRRLPPALGHMTSLRSLPLDGNPLKLMRRELWAGPVSALLQHLRDQEQQASAPTQACAVKGTGAHVVPAGGCEVVEGAVSLKGRGLTQVPTEVWEAGDAITSLDVSDNNLAAEAANMAAGLAQLSAVRVLVLNSCALSTWPLPGIKPGCLPALHTLELRGNALQPCPVDALAACPHLKRLDLSGVKSLQLPAGMFAATPQLEELVASRAGLSDFPAAALTCSSLKRLNLSCNSLSSVPLHVTQLTRLEELDLQNNQLSNLPPQVGLMAPHLRVLLLEGNCIRVIRRAVLEKGTAAVLEWLKDRIPA